jgi:hypothetical protein
MARLLSLLLSGPHQAGDRVGRFGELPGRRVTALRGCLGDAVTEMVFQQAQRHRLQGIWRLGSRWTSRDSLLGVVPGLEDDPADEFPFAQRFTGTISDDARTISGCWEKADNGREFTVDFYLTYHKQAPAEP